LRRSYSLIAPVYDLFVDRPMRNARRNSIGALPVDTAGNVLLSGTGTGLDLPLLPALHQYIALDFNAAMLSRARLRKRGSQVAFIMGDSMSLPFADNYFDHVVLHLITAVVPEPLRCLSESARVLKPGGTIILFDKFLQHGQVAPVRRMLTALSRHIATRMDVVFEEILADVPELEIVSDKPILAGGWFRSIVLRKMN
jgi:ubiquinone/menaquinone biosynthesis C-methylase UbiE